MGDRYRKQPPEIEAALRKKARAERLLAAQKPTPLTKWDQTIVCAVVREAFNNRRGHGGSVGVTRRVLGRAELGALISKALRLARAERSP